MKTKYFVVLAIAIGAFVLWQNKNINSSLFQSFNNSEIDFSSQVKPIINKHCISCHGGVKKASGFGMLFRTDALEKAKSGKAAIVPFHPELSEFVKRLSSKDPEERMPYKSEPLAKEEIEILTKWVKEGAKWGDHWAYVAPKEQKIPNKGFFAGLFDFGRWEKNDIDYFVNDRLKKEGFSPKDEADKETLLRRAAFDIVGLPPTTQQVQKYMADKSNDWYEKYVDELLKSPQFGERWASMWLDLARYSDSRGYQKDNARNIWQYRDYVIKSFNEDKSFNQFTTEQIAGDLLAKPTENQLIATAFHRNTMNNDETGTLDEEYRVSAIIDRINTTFDVWQGTTIGCVQCHSHPYDPFRHEDYYKLMAFFNNSRDEDTIDEAPNFRKFSEKDKGKLDSLSAWINANLPSQNANEIEKFIRYLEPRHHAHYADNYVNGALLGDRNIGLRNKGTCRLPNIKLDGKNTFLINYQSKNVGGTMEVRKDSPTGEVLAKIKLDTTSRNKPLFIPIKPIAGRYDLYLTGNNPRLKPEQDVFQINWFVFMENFWKDDKQKLQDFKYLITARTENTPIMLASHPDYERKTKIFERGNWLVHGKEVKPDVPNSLKFPPFTNTLNRDLTRLDLSKWILDKNNPLTARTIANRYWEQIFGTGLVETIEDFGTQGTKPSHPELLDFLAIKFRDDFQWKPKVFIKFIVMSATYRQESVSSEQLAEVDHQNRLFAHGARIRLTSEMIRDQALAVSGLLSNKMYGKPVMPYQPDNIWQAVNSSLKFKQSEGEDQYRRAIYTFARRTGPYPQQFTFDAPSREVCTQRRIRTNTPIQALQLLNDPVFMEASENLAKWMQKNGNNIDEQINAGYKRIFIREIKKNDLNSLKNLYQKAFSKTKNDKVFSMTIVANAMMNLDEFVTKQ